MPRGGVIMADENPRMVATEISAVLGRSRAFCLVLAGNGARSATEGTNL